MKVNALRTTLLLWCTLAATTIAGVGVASADTVAVSVTPLISEMRVAAGDSGQTWTEVTNNGDGDERISVEPIDWSTNSRGTISLEAPGSEGKHSLTKYLQALSYRFILHPHETRRLNVALSMPASPASQSYWGGFIIKSQPLDGTLAISPAATFFVYDDVGNPKRHVSIAAVHQSQAAKHAVRLNIDLKNDGDAYARTAGTLVLSKEGRTLREQQIPIGAILPGRNRFVAATISGLAPGIYSARMIFDYGGDLIVGAETSVTIP